MRCMRGIHLAAGTARRRKGYGPVNLLLAREAASHISRVEDRPTGGGRHRRTHKLLRKHLRRSIRACRYCWTTSIKQGYTRSEADRGTGGRLRGTRNGSTWLLQTSPAAILLRTNVPMQSSQKL